MGAIRANKTSFKRGQIPWNKNKKGVMPTPWNKGKKGLQVAWNKGMAGYGSGEKNSFYGKKHSDKTKEKMSKMKIGKTPSNKGIKRAEISGELHWNWKGGITPKNKKLHNVLEYKLWHRSVLQRDNFTCQKTGIRGGRLVAHHINNFAEFPELRFAIDNGITLSEKVHKEFHQKYGRKNNTKEQLEEFFGRKFGKKFIKNIS